MLEGSLAPWDPASNKAKPKAPSFCFSPKATSLDMWAQTVRLSSGLIWIQDPRWKSVTWSVECELLLLLHGPNLTLRPFWEDSPCNTPMPTWRQLLSGPHASSHGFMEIQGEVILGSFADVLLTLGVSTKNNDWVPTLSQFSLCQTMGTSPLEATVGIFWVQMVQPGQGARKSLVGRLWRAQKS